MGVVRLRLARFGRKHLPHYRIVAAHIKSKRDGKHIEQLGSYSPVPDRHGQKKLRLKEARIKYWLGVGAQPSDTVARLLGVAGILPPYPYRPRPVKMIPKRERREFSTVAGGARAAAARAAAGSRGVPAAAGASLLTRRATGTPFACWRQPRFSPAWASSPMSVLAAACAPGVLGSVPRGRGLPSRNDYD